jgi:hypothetical protein
MIDEIKKLNYKINLSKSDQLWIQNEYPNIKILPNKLSGEICFQRTYNNITILDSFNIEIFLSHNEQSILPKVKCLDNKIENIAKFLNLKMDQLHTNPDGSFCLTVYPKEKSFFTNGQFNIQEFFINLLEPYLYWICYYEKYNQAPWGEYSHGSLGIFEFIAEENLDFRKIYKILKMNNISLRKILSLYRQSKCICGEKKSKVESKIRKCHNKAWSGIVKIKVALGHRLPKK